MLKTDEKKNEMCLFLALAFSPLLSTGIVTKYTTKPIKLTV